MGNVVTGKNYGTGAASFMGSDTGYLFGTPSLTTVSSWVDDYLGAGSTGYFTSFVNNNWIQYLSGSHSSYKSVYLTASGWQARDTSGVGVTDNLGNKVDVGSYISIVACPLRTFGANVRKLAIENGASGGNTTYNTDGAAAYAGFIGSLDPHIGSTNKVVPGVIPAKKMSFDQIETLMNRRLVTMITRARGFVVAKGVTGAYHVDNYTKSDFTQLTTQRITHAAIDQVRLSCEPFIGEPHNGPNISSMREAIEGGLRNMQLAGALQRYDFAIIATPDQQVLGQMTVDLTIVPAFEILDIQVNVTLAKE